MEPEDYSNDNMDYLPEDNYVDMTFAPEAAYA